MVEINMVWKQSRYLSKNKIHRVIENMFKYIAGKETNSWTIFTLLYQMLQYSIYDVITTHSFGHPKKKDQSKSCLNLLRQLHYYLFVLTFTHFLAHSLSKHTQHLDQVQQAHSQTNICSKPSNIQNAEKFLREQK